MPISKAAFPRKSLVLLGVLALALALMACLSVGSASAADPTYVYTDITTDTWWNDTGAPVILNQSVTVQAGATLTIGQNVTVMANNGVQLIVNGTLIVNGAEGKLVNFTKNATSWEGIVFNPTSTGSSICMADINNVSNAAISVTDSSLTLNNVNFAYVDSGVAASYTNASKSLTVTNCYFDNRDGDSFEVAIDVEIRASAYGTASTVATVELVITDNVFQSYYNAPIDVDRTAVGYDNSSVTLAGATTITGNTINKAGPIFLLGYFAGMTIDSTSNAVDNATVNLNGTILVCQNDITGNVGSGIVVVRSVTASDENCSANMNVRIQITENYIEGDNHGTPVIVNTAVVALGWSASDLIGDVLIERNEVDGDSTYDLASVSLSVNAQDYAEVCVNSALNVLENEATDVGGVVAIAYSVAGIEQASVGAYCPVNVNDNIGLDCSHGVVLTYVINSANKAEVDYDGALAISGNSFTGCNGPVSVTRTITSTEDAELDVDMPVTIGTNELYDFNNNGVHVRTVASANHNSTLDLSGDVAVEGNTIDVDSAPLPEAVDTDKYAIYVYNSVNANSNVVETSSTVAFDVSIADNEIVASIGGVYVYTLVNAVASSADAYATFIGDVEVCSNVIELNDSDSAVFVDFEVKGSNTLGNNTSTVDGEVVISENDVTLYMGEGLKVQITSTVNEYLEGNYAELDLAVQVLDNTVTGETPAILAPAVPAAVNAAIEVIGELGNEVLVSGNDVVLERGNCLRVRGGEVLVQDNSFVTENGDGMLINNNLGNTTVKDNYVKATLKGIKISCAGVLLEDNIVEMIEGQAIFLDSDAEGAVIENNVLSGAQTGLYVEGSYNVTIRNNHIRDNNLGVGVYGAEEVTFCSNDVRCNNGNGAIFSNCYGLLVEDNTFAQNGRYGAEFTHCDSDEEASTVIGNNTFSANWEDGLVVTNCDYVTIYNGVYDDNEYFGIDVEASFGAEWIVDAASEVRNNNVYFVGNIFIRDGGVLTLSAVPSFVVGYAGGVTPTATLAVPLADTIYFGNDMAWILVEEGGSLVALNVAFMEEEGYDDVYSYSDPWMFVVKGELDMMDCQVYGAVNYLGPTSEATISTSTFMYAYGNGITIDGCSPIISGCTIMDNGKDGIYIMGAEAKPVIKGCIIAMNYRGVYARDTCLNSIVDNIFVMNALAGVYAERATGSIHDNVFLLNHKEIFVVDSTVSIVGNQIGYSKLIEAGASYLPALLTLANNLPISGLLMPSDVEAPGESYMSNIEDYLWVLNDHIGIYAVGSDVTAKGNTYGMLSTAAYVVDSNLVFNDSVKTNTMVLSWYNVEGVLVNMSIPLYVYDGVFATNSDVRLNGACIEVLDDALFLEDCTGEAGDCTFLAEDFDLYLMEGTAFGVHGCDYAKYMIEDTSMLYIESLLTLTVKTQDGFGIAGATVNITDANGKVWATGVTDGKGVFKAYLPQHALCADGKENASFNPYKVSASKDNTTGSGSFTMDDKATSASVTLAMKQNSIFGMDPLVVGAIALVIVMVLVGVLFYARKK